ncbi:MULTISPECIES: DUF6207 family protein [unclassified Streptomyces]|uniref:DUF6207 family protein n=1 Tax=unclassified Streptomyces TaxID=2593676 RepID=UPI002255FB94|nr:DUF6207 family protein [Streptomyces sp. NBC_00340]MCX5134803.1 DUF6207 family protein [Streptomyces sp. NBC_00340]
MPGRFAGSAGGAPRRATWAEPGFAVEIAAADDATALAIQQLLAERCGCCGAGDPTSPATGNTRPGPHPTGCASCPRRRSGG